MKTILGHIFMAFVCMIGIQAQTPEIISLSPDQNAVAIPTNTVIGVQFDNDINPATLTDATFTVHGAWTGRHAGEVSFQPGVNLAIFAPATNFIYGEPITVALTSDVLALDGTPLSAGFGWHFITEVNTNSRGEFYQEINYNTGDRPYSICTGDVDGDGDFDLITTNFDANSISVMFNNGDGVFVVKADFPVGDGPWIAACIDLDGDGDLDIATTNQHGNDMTVTLNNGHGIFSGVTHYPAGPQPHGLAAADLDGDGDCDLAVPNRFTDNVSLFFNNGDATFTYGPTVTTKEEPISIVAADFDNDGDFDLATSNYLFGTASILLNNGDGTFAGHCDIDVGSGAFSLVATNVDRDADIDLVVVNRNANSISVLCNDGTGAFYGRTDYMVEEQPYSICTGDFNGDHHLDLAVANFYGPSVSVLLNNGDATFVTDAVYPVGNAPYDPVWVNTIDANGNGMLDIVTSNSYSDNISLLLNQPKAPLFIEPDTMYAYEANATDPTFATVSLFGMVNGHNLAQIAFLTMRINGTITPGTILMSTLYHMDLVVSRSTFIETYGTVYDTTEQQFTLTGKMNNGTSFSITGEVTLIGHTSGDVNADGDINLLDLLYMIEHVYHNGPAPIPDIHAGDVDHSGELNLLDILRMITDVFGEP